MFAGHTLMLLVLSCRGSFLCVFSTVTDVAKTLHFNSEIVGFNVQEKTVNLDPPVEIDFGLFDVSCLQNSHF